MTGATFVANEVVAALEKFPLEDGVPVIESAMASVRSVTLLHVGSGSGPDPDGWCLSFVFCLSDCLDEG